ncbi:AraC family transcriptional regulator [Halosquirtibacter laminarini]|uniref:AraC family transcriptional regulator n=1 Tax=Halosquirtibacter laminarini TaxID=3374600 RepID=A0AC61NEK7_9BACT|nr:AraC family transcriptional regulator [Prolixibacteraceae bacterium]
MEQSFKYLTYNENDILWGIYANVAGVAVIKPGEKYPPSGHPNNYNFKWENGRILDEFQLLYITQGTGVFETKTKKYNVKEGDTILLFPYEWHRYRPMLETGWTEYYVGFNGGFNNQMMHFFSPDNPVNYIGFNEQVHQSFKIILQLSSEEKIGFQQAIGGQIIYLLGQVRLIVTNNAYANNAIERIINQSRVYMRSNVTENIRMEDLACDLKISYSLFRTEFKKYTGVSPGQYLLQLKIQLAKNLLSNTQMSIKEVSYNSGFESPYYFSRVFKKYTNATPSEFRHRIRSHS